VGAKRAIGGSVLLAKHRLLSEESCLWRGKAGSSRDRAALRNDKIHEGIKERAPVAVMVLLAAADAYVFEAEGAQTG
jgi:hypothetical protein